MADSPSKPSKLDESFLAGLADLKKVGRYEIIYKIGQGAAGIVYLGRDPYIKRYVAIKISRPTSERGKERFFVEAQSAGRLNHPNIVAVYDLGVYNEFCYITMEYVEGHTLEKVCRAKKLLPPRQALETMFSVVNAFDYAHKEGIIHRDIKPSNIMVDVMGNAKITDFGTAQMTEETSEMGIWGTPSYMSPEQLQEEDVGPFSDIFSLGCVFYEILTGKQAFPGNNNFSIMYKVTNEEPPPISTIRKDLPPAVDQILKKALAKKKQDRYQSCMDFAYDLKFVLRGLGHSRAPKKDKVQDAIDFIHNVPFFRNFTKGQVAEVANVGEILKFEKGQDIVKEGEIDDHFFIILSGRTKISKNGQQVAVLSSGECFGEMAFIACQPRVATVTADTDCMLMRISATLFDRSPPPVQLRFFKNFATILVRRFS
ncbi:serine/threonine protein kinase [Desulfatibacillum alkenivorans DSM 16219]|jgi:serine/threonine-protein kinase|uniref:non-specific serine/threonine protein kinase n=1 Tax=Desulfatibacillum alkenivorans DSM 16219 TaxID=1121393 RepID=A0A1M6FPT6_9BACT|nr:serine/threonine-protein kinase [Desulfatibacillum alkenivorans]SHI99683.1 serine/threonine protein kinase [Desulfatibacillum alkenivorans DSM 16219]